jgi:hypothetical protein
MNKTLRNNSGLTLFGMMSAALLVPATIALAADGATSYIPLVSVPGLFTAGTATNPVEIIKGIYGLAIGIGSVIATVMIIYAGFEYMYVESMGQKSAAKERIQNAFWGLLVILGSYILLRTINPSLVEFNITLPAGTGELGKLVAADKDALRREKSISDALKADAIAKAEIATLQAGVTDIDARIAGLKKQQAGKATTSPEFKDVQVIIDAQEAEKQRLNSQINQKTVASTGAILQTLLTDGQDNVMINEIKALGTAGLDYKTSDAFNLIKGRKASTLARLNKELSNIQALPETPNKAVLLSDFEADVASYKEYIAVSDRLVGSIGTIIETPRQRVPINQVMNDDDKKIRAVLNTVEIEAKKFETGGRPEIADQLRKDSQNSILIAKMKYKNYCSSQTAQVIVCSK